MAGKREALADAQALIGASRQRLLSAEAEVPLHHMRAGTMGDADWSKLASKMAPRMGGVVGAPAVGGDIMEASEEMENTPDEGLAGVPLNHGYFNAPADEEIPAGIADSSEADTRPEIRSMGPGSSRLRVEDAHFDNFLARAKPTDARPDRTAKFAARFAANRAKAAKADGNGEAPRSASPKRGIFSRIGGAFSKAARVIGNGFSSLRSRIKSMFGPRQAPLGPSTTSAFDPADQASNARMAYGQENYERQQAEREQMRPDEREHLDAVNHPVNFIHRANMVAMGMNPHARMELDEAEELRRMMTIDDEPRHKEIPDEPGTGGGWYPGVVEESRMNDSHVAEPNQNGTFFPEVADFRWNVGHVTEPASARVRRARANLPSPESYSDEQVNAEGLDDFDRRFQRYQNEAFQYGEGSSGIMGSGGVTHEARTQISGEFFKKFRDNPRLSFGPYARNRQQDTWEAETASAELQSEPGQGGAWYPDDVINSRMDDNYVAAPSLRKVPQPPSRGILKTGASRRGGVKWRDENPSPEAPAERIKHFDFLDAPAQLADEEEYGDEQFSVPDDTREHSWHRNSKAMLYHRKAANMARRTDQVHDMVKSLPPSEAKSNTYAQDLGTEKMLNRPEARLEPFEEDEMDALRDSQRRSGQMQAKQESAFQKREAKQQAAEAKRQAGLAKKLPRVHEKVSQDEQDYLDYYKTFTSEAKRNHSDAQPLHPIAYHGLEQRADPQFAKSQPSGLIDINPNYFPGEGGAGSAFAGPGSGAGGGRADDRPMFTFNEDDAELAGGVSMLAIEDYIGSSQAQSAGLGGASGGAASLIEEEGAPGQLIQDAVQSDGAEPQLKAPPKSLQKLLNNPSSAAKAKLVGPQPTEADNAEGLRMLSANNRKIRENTLNNRKAGHKVKKLLGMAKDQRIDPEYEGASSATAAELAMRARLAREEGLKKGNKL
jgi:hypothetical protein